MELGRILRLENKGVDSSSGNDVDITHLGATELLHSGIKYSGKGWFGRLKRNGDVIALVELFPEDEEDKKAIAEKKEVVVNEVRKKFGIIPEE